MKEIRGSCLCGAVEYAVEDDFKYAAYCHCSQCRKFSGSAFSAFGGVAKPSFHVLKGAECISHYHKSENTVLSFCQVCGSSLYAEKVNKGMVHVRLGTLNESPCVRPQAHVFVDSKAPWYEIKDELVRFEAMPPVNKKAT
jgi:hypothetical protein